MAKDEVEDGRPLVVLTVADFDPAGWQMPISIGRKLQALRDLCFPGLQFKVVPVAMTPEQVREFGLPSTPLKQKEKRADKWLAEFGLAQTELDALATARPDILRQVVEQGLDPFYDRTLAGRIARAKDEWHGRAQRIIDARVDPEEVEGIQRDLDDLAADATRRIEAIKAEISERVSEADERLRAMVSGIRLPPIPKVPEAVLPTGETHVVRVVLDRANARPEGPENLRRRRVMTAVVLGIDIGATGAVALLTADGELVWVEDMPVLNDGPAGRRTVNAPLLAELLAKSHATQAFVEFVAARPGESSTGAFSFGRSRGVIEGVCAALSIPVTMLTPPRWKRIIGIAPGKGGKDAARSEAIRRWPGRASLFARKSDDGRAEAALIAVAGLNEIPGRRPHDGDRDVCPVQGNDAPRGLLKHQN